MTLVNNLLYVVSVAAVSIGGAGNGVGVAAFQMNRPVVRLPPQRQLLRSGGVATSMVSLSGLRLSVSRVVQS
jgi:hypothetical protein|eukprot:scaffold696_cov197-Alexandrium_tamarense.AAC.4